MKKIILLIIMMFAFMAVSILPQDASPAPAISAGQTIAENVTQAVGGDVVKTSNVWQSISLWVGQIAIILTAIAALDPTNKVNKIVSKVLGVCRAIGFLDKGKK